MSHHWIDNPDFGADPDDAEGPTDVTHLCKHCDAVGDHCPTCEGLGDHDCDPDPEDGSIDWEFCPTCHGEGVIARKAVNHV